MSPIRALLPRIALGFVVVAGCVGCGSDPVTPDRDTVLDAWLQAHPAIMAALVWDAGDGRGPQPYSAWTNADKLALDEAVAYAERGTERALAEAVAYAERGTERALADPPVNLAANRFDDDFAGVTVLGSSDARALYFAYVGRSLMLEMTGALPWSIAGYDAKSLALLLDSRAFFVWMSNVLGAELSGHVLFGSSVGDYVTSNPAIVSWVLPAPPRIAASFLSSNNLLGATRVETIARLLEWERANMSHFIGGFSLRNAVIHWQYRGTPPASRIIAGTFNTAFNPPFHSHWTLGCPGTNSFMTAVLRAVNIPVELVVVEQHATPSFPSERLYLSHGDDPYSRAWSRSTPTVPASELLISEATYTAWFSPSLPGAQRLANIGRRTRELMVEHLTDRILLHRCADLAAGHTDRATSRVYDAVRTTYTLAELEAMDLWTRLDAKIASRGGCAAIPPL